MKAALERMPFGMYVGAPAVRVEIDDKEQPTAAELAHAIAEHSGPGVVCLHFARAPWAAPWWPEVLTEAQAKLPTVVDVVGVLRLDALTWVSADVHWTMDASVLFDRTVLEAGGIDRVLESVGQFPRAHDLIVRDPTVDVVTPALLDGVAAHLSVDRPGQLLTPASTVDRLLPVLARASTPWVLVTS